MFDRIIIAVLRLDKWNQWFHAVFRPANLHAKDTFILALDYDASGNAMSYIVTTIWETTLTEIGRDYFSIHENH